MEKFTKIYKTERELLRKCNNVAAYEIYMHLKDDSAYYKGEFYDLSRCISEYLDISPSTLKRALKALKEVGLIEVSKKGKVNIYKLPYAQEKVEKQDKKEQESMNEDKTELFKVAAVKENVNENIGDFRPEMSQNDTRVQQDIESVPKGQQMGKNEGLIMEMEKNLTTAQINAAMKDTRKDLSVSQNLKQIEYRLGWVLHKYSRAEREKYYKFLLKTA